MDNSNSKKIRQLLNIVDEEPSLFCKACDAIDLWCGNCSIRGPKNIKNLRSSDVFYESEMGSWITIWDELDTVKWGGVNIDCFVKSHSSNLLRSTLKNDCNKVLKLNKIKTL